jgi:excisionase family DNA binding protein
MTDRYFIPFGTEVLILTETEFETARARNAELAPLPQDDQPVWLRVPEVARLCSVSPTYLYDAIRVGDIKTRNFGKGVRIHRSFVEHQINNLVNDDGTAQ